MATPQGILPFLPYEDGAAALDWLTRAFGFRATILDDQPDGIVWAATVETGSGAVGIGERSPKYESPRRHAERCDRFRQSYESHSGPSLTVFVSDIETHYARAQAAGAEILVELHSGRYTAYDLEGNCWCFVRADEPEPDEPDAPQIAPPLFSDVHDG